MNNIGNTLHNKTMQSNNKKISHLSNYILILLLLLFSLFLISCSIQSSKDYGTGTEGIRIEMLDVNKGDRFIQGQNLNIVLEISNQGRYDEPMGHIAISGYDPSAIFFSEQKKELPFLLAKNQYTDGESKIIKIEELQPLKVPYGSSYKTNIMFSTCYNYQTKATLPVCIIPNIDEYVKGTSTCRIEPTSLSTQGAPVAVTYIEPSMSNDQLQFLIHIANVGKGVIIKEDHLNDCPTNIGLTDIDELVIEARISALGYAECTNNGRVKLIDGKGVALCYLPKGFGTYSYTTEMEITLNYGYSTSINKQIEVINPFYTGQEQNSGWE